MNKVITVSREFGSGGRELGVKLAEALGIPFYDKELISMQQMILILQRKHSVNTMSM